MVFKKSGLGLEKWSWSCNLVVLLHHWCQPSIRGDASTTKSIFNTIDVVFDEIFLLSPYQQHKILFKMCDQLCSQSRHWFCD